MSARPDTFLLTLPNGSKVRCWTKDAEALRNDVFLFGDIFLMKDPATEVYERIAPDSVEAPTLRKHGRQAG